VVGVEVDGSTVDVAVGETLTVELPSNPSTGYSWQVIDPGPCDEPEAAEYIEGQQDEALVGASGIERFEFTRSSADPGDITLEYRRPWDDASVPAEDAWTVHLD
jgi:inhibitor of cysteine peptidase